VHKVSDLTLPVDTCAVSLVEPREDLFITTQQSERQLQGIVSQTIAIENGHGDSRAVVLSVKPVMGTGH
jgi:hypothetical protein